MKAHVTVIVLCAMFFCLRSFAQEPRLVFDTIPALGSFDDLAGHVEHVIPGNFRVAVYIFVDSGGGWWNKPSFEGASTPIDPSGLWSVDVTTGGADEWASKIAAFLVDQSFSPPLLSGSATLPPSLLAAARAQAAVRRSALGNTRLVYFSGHEWWVKTSDWPAGPGPNYFSDSLDNVWLDDANRLHLKISKVGTRYHCAEVVSTASFGHGAYMFHLDTPVALIDPMAVLGLFTWSDTPDFHYREIDIEYSRWGDPNNQAGQFVVQPWDGQGNIDRFTLGLDAAPTVSTFIWGPESVEFFSVMGNTMTLPDPNGLIHSWTYTGPDLPEPGDENARMNLWLMSGQPPADGLEQEVIVRAFEFVPYSELEGGWPPKEPMPMGNAALPCLILALIATSARLLTNRKHPGCP